MLTRHWFNFDKGRAAKAIAALSVSAMALVACGDNGDSADADETFTLTYTTYSTQDSDQSRTVQRWAEDVEQLTDGGVTVEFHYSESLVDAEDSLQATTDGRADLAQAASFYNASDLPMYTVAEMPFETDNPEAQLRSLNLLYEENDAYRSNFEDQGVRQLFPLPIGIATLGLNEPADSVSDLSGRSIRAGGVVGEAIQAAGGNPVGMVATDVYESMARGVIDGYTSLGLSNLSTFGVSDNTPYLVNPGIGSYASSVVVVSQDMFESMPESYQDALLEASENAVEYALEELDEASRLACEELRESGTEFGSFSADDVEAWSNEAGLSDAWVETQGEAAEGVLADYRTFIEDTTAESDYTSPLIECMGGE